MFRLSYPMRPATPLRFGATLVVALFLSACCRRLDLAALPPLPPGRMVEAGGHQLFVRQTGEGPDVVLLHGMGDSSLGWQFVEPELVKAGYRVTVWDALGAGRSDKPAHGDYRIVAHAERLENVLDALEVRKAVLVGHSLGGSEALVFARKNPEKVRALVLLDPAAYRAGAMGGRWFWTTPLLADLVLGVLPSRTITWIALKQNFHDRGKISCEIEALYLREARRPGTATAFIAQERQIVPDDPEKWEDGHRAIRQPALILWGRKDRIVPVAQGERLAKDIEGSRLVVLPCVGHSPHLEAPQQVLEHVLPFLEEWHLIGKTDLAAVEVEKALGDR